jgi:uncharacterized membrane protein
MELLRVSVSAGEEVQYRIKNIGSVELICGLGYGLERETGYGSIHLNPGMAFPAVGLGISPGRHRDLTARVPVDAPAGRYRIGTSVSSDHAKEIVRLSARFDVHDNR